MSKEEGLGIELIRFPIESYLLLDYMKSRGMGGEGEGEPKKILLKKKTHWKTKSLGTGGSISPLTKKKTPREVLSQKNK